LSRRALPGLFAIGLGIVGGLMFAGFA
jgi:hypothetical protein